MLFYNKIVDVEVKVKKNRSGDDKLFFLYIIYRFELLFIVNSER